MSNGQVMCNIRLQVLTEVLLKIPVLLGCYTVWLGEQFLACLRNTVLS